MPPNCVSDALERRVALVDVFVQQRTARVARPLTYLVPAGVGVRIGDVLRVPLGPRDLYGYAIALREGRPPPRARALVGLGSDHRAFDEAGLALARWIAQRCCCSLGEALATVAFAPALPRVVDRFIVSPSASPPPATVPPRLLRLIDEELAGGFTVETVLRHPEARRAGDRRTLLASLATLQRAGILRRERTFLAPQIAEKHARFLTATELPIAGRRARALVAHVAEAGTLRRSDVLLAGFSAALIARAVGGGALRETTARVEPVRNAARAESVLAPNAAQRAAIEAIGAAVGAGTFGELLLHGITGSGKTLVYLRAIAGAVAQGGRAIVLVPEISLTPQTARRFEATFGDRVAVLHSALSERERFESWSAAARGAVDVVVGARSAVFAPLPDVRLVVVDEAHERTYKQETAPRYDAVAVARERMRLAQGTLVLGSATPPLETYEAARRGAIGYLRLEARATELPLPATQIVDLAAEFERGNRRIFSSRLVAALGARLERGEKTVLFVNRRGSARFMLCRACGSVPECPRCSLSLVVHRAEALLRCHLCDAQRAIPVACPACNAGAIREFGIGTQTVADAVAELFPAARVVRMDGDTTTRIGDHARLLETFETSGDVLVGTQMVAKGLDFAAVTLVGVVAADAGLHAPDFRAAERTFDLITQVAGRSGRARPGEAIVQTYAPAHPAIALAARHDFDTFAILELEQRRALRYPPFAQLIYLGIIGRVHAAVVAAARKYAELVAGAVDCEVLGPAPYPIARVNDEWRYRLVLKATDGEPVRRYVRDVLIDLASTDRSVRLTVNVDP